MEGEGGARRKKSPLMNWIRSGEEEEKRRRRRRASTLGFGTKPEGGREKKGFPSSHFPRFMQTRLFSRRRRRKGRGEKMGEKRLFNSVWAWGALFLLERREESGPPRQLCSSSSSRALKEW